MKKFLALFMALLMAFSLSACGGKTDNEVPTDAETEAILTDSAITDALVGRWMGGEEGERIGYQFNSDGTGMAAFFPFTYTVEDGIITITITAFGETQTGSAAYDVSGDTITLTKDGETYTLTRFEE